MLYSLLLTLNNMQAFYQEAVKDKQRNFAVLHSLRRCGAPQPADANSNDKYDNIMSAASIAIVIIIVNISIRSISGLARCHV